MGFLDFLKKQALKVEEVKPVEVKLTAEPEPAQVNSKHRDRPQNKRGRKRSAAATLRYTQTIQSLDKEEFKGKLTEEHKKLVCSLSAQFETPRRICSVLKEKYGIEVNEKAIYGYTSESSRWKPLIDKLRIQYALNLGGIPLYHKRIRLERLEEQYSEILKEKDSTAQSRLKKRSELRSVLREAREEVKPWEDAESKRGDTNILSIQFNGMDDSELLRKRDDLLKVIKTIPIKEVKQSNVEFIESKVL